MQKYVFFKKFKAYWEWDLMKCIKSENDVVCH